MPSRADRRQFVVGAAVLVGAVFLAYLPVVHGGSVWDDDYMFTANPVVADPRGLGRIWFDLSAVQVYYPLTLSVLWAECRAFGLADLTGYHVVHTLVHAANAVLAWRLLRRLAVPGPFAVALLWGLHPACVESVAWLTELKNTLSGLFYLLSMGALLRYFGVINDGERLNGARGPLLAVVRPPHAGRWYVLALVVFGLALAAKTTAVTLPAAALLLVWYRTGRVRAGQVWAVVPLLAVAAVAGGLTQYVETTYTGTWQDRWGLTRPQQVLVAGRALWFYAAKLAWPAGLSFAYPRWRVDPAVWWQWAYPAAAAAVIGGLWAARRRLGRGPLVGVLFFAGTLAPALGFFHVLYQRYSFVADHFQYLAGLGLIAVAVGAIATWPRAVRVTVVTAAAVALGVTTAVSSRRFTSDLAAWTSAVAVNPSVPFANVNAASDLIDQHQFAAAEPYLDRAAADPAAMAGVWSARGRIAEDRQAYPTALACYARAVSVDGLEPRFRYQLGTMLLVLQRWADAEGQLRAALAYQSPLAAAIHDNLGVALLHQGHAADAAAEFRAARALDPTLPLVRRHLAEAGVTTPF